MMKHIVFVHSAGEQKVNAGSNPLIHYLKTDTNAEWHTPRFPREEGQVYRNWVKVLQDELAAIPIEDDIIIIGHSFGGSVVMKYLTEHRDPHHISKVIMIGSPYWGCDEKFDDEQNELSAHAEDDIDPGIELYHVQSVDDDRVPFTHQACWHNKFPILNIIKKASGGHEFHEGIEELIPLLDDSQQA